MGGGKSSTSQESRQDTTQLSSDGVIVGDLFQGKSVTVNQDFPDAVGEAFGQLITLATGAVDLAGQAGGRALDISSTAIDKVSDRTSFSENPEIQTLDRYLPFFMLTAVGATLYFLIRKGK